MIGCFMPPSSEVITSPDNPLIKRLARLHQARHRREDGLFLAEGRRTIDALLAAGCRADALLLRDGEALPEGWPTAAVRVVGERVAQKLSQASTACGFIAALAAPAPPALDAAAGGLVLAEIGDPGNLGTLLRSAAAFGVGQVALIGGADPFAHKVVQATAGTLASVALHQFEAEAGLAPLRGGAPCCALVVSGGVAPARLAPGPRWLVVGSEAHGLRAEWLAACSERLTLPMPGRVESLNAAVAGSIACYLLGTRTSEALP
jgi:TrmH family RNA methyltransferase